jgi:hypothetical protein
MKIPALLFIALLTLGRSAELVAADAAAPVQPSPVLATWSLGNGSIAGQTAAPGAGITVGQRVGSTSDQPAKLVFATPLSGSLTLSPGAVFTLVEETVADHQELVVDLAEGAIQVDLHAKGAYTAVRVRGAAIDVRVTGTLFVVQRVKRDADYVALVQGRLSAGLRKEVSDALGQDKRFDLESRQGIGASTTGGLDHIASLTNRPQIASLKESIQDQGTGPQEGDGGWDKDLAFDLLNDLLDQLGLGDALVGELVDALGDALFDDLNSGPGEQVISTSFTSSAGVLGAPPPPPPIQ